MFDCIKLPIAWCRCCLLSPAEKAAVSSNADGSDSRRYEMHVISHVRPGTSASDSAKCV